MMTDEELQAMFAALTAEQVAKVQQLQRKNWTVIHYYQLLGKVIMASPPKEGLSYTRTIYRDGHG